MPTLQQVSGRNIVVQELHDPAEAPRARRQARHGDAAAARRFEGAPHVIFRRVPPQEPRVHAVVRELELLRRQSAGRLQGDALLAQVERWAAAGTCELRTRRRPPATATAPR